MIPPPIPRIWRRAPEAALLMVLCGLLMGGNCTGNAGAVFDPSPPGTDGGGGGGGGGGNPGPGPAAAPVEGALILAGRPFRVATAPADGAQGVDVHAVVMVWFNESLNATTLTLASLGLRIRGTTGSIGLALRTFVADRCVALVPASNLQTDTVYEVFATTDVLDLDGGRLKIPKKGFLAAFKTASTVQGVAPRVLGFFPPAGSANVPNDHSVLLVFSKPVDFTTVSGAVTLTNTTTMAPGSFDVARSSQGNRIVEFPHLGDGSDLGASMEVMVDTTITDTEFNPLNLEAPFQSSWTTLAFGRPSSLQVIDPAGAVNLGNLTGFLTEAVLPQTLQNGDIVRLQVHESAGEKRVLDTFTTPGGTMADFSTDLSDGKGQPFLADGTLILGAFLERSGLRSTTRVILNVIQDTIRPGLLRFGPPDGSLTSRFVTDVPELRPYGIATEPVTKVLAEFPVGGTALLRTVPQGDPNSFFLGPAFPAQASPGEGPFDFNVLLSDAAGNDMQVPVAGSALFRGFLGDQPLTGGPLRVVAFNRRSLDPVVGATVWVESFGGADPEEKGTTGSDGSVTFLARTGPQTITISATDFTAASLVGVDTDLVSLPLREANPVFQSISPIVTGVAGGIARLASSLIQDENGVDRPDGLFDAAVPIPFGSIFARPDRPGWFASFQDVQPFDPGPNRYYELFGLDPRAMIAPSDPGRPRVSPLLALASTTNVSGGNFDFIYLISPLAKGTGFQLPPLESTASALMVIPGLDGPATAGAGSLSLPQAEVEVEQLLHDRAALEGAPTGTVELQVFARDQDGDRALARLPVVYEASPAAVPLNLPDIPVVGIQTGGPFAGLSLTFAPSLGVGEGYYRLTLEDTAAVPAQWDLWVPASVGAPGSLALPALMGDPPPLLTGPGTGWTLQCEAFGMPPGFLQTGFFFTQLLRDNLTWAAAVSSPAFEVD
ncbi:MAG: Ig-like domain-containing protein [Planctomycetota bacterium]